MSEVNAVATSTDAQLQAMLASRTNSTNVLYKTLSSVGRAIPLVGGFLDLLGIKSGSDAPLVQSTDQATDRFMTMLAIQQQIQMESQIFTMATNVSKARHEADMAAVRNIR